MSTEVLSFGERVGQLFTVLAAGLSLVSVGFILVFAFIRWMRRRMAPRVLIQFEATDSSLFLNLMFADFVQAIGEMPTLRWVIDGRVSDGSLCQAQAGLRHFGVLGVAFSSLGIAFYTFYVLVLRRIPHKYACRIGCIIIWIIACLVGGTSSIVHSHKGESFYGPSGRYWCWIRFQWRSEQLLTSYLWMWTAAGGMMIVYGIIFMSIRGWIRTPRSGYVHDTSSSSVSEEPMFKQTKGVARLMLYFPLVYIVTILAASVTRWTEFGGGKVPYQATLFANTMFRLSGFFNFVLFITTRPRMALGDKVIVHKTVQQTIYPTTSYNRRQSHSLQIVKEPYEPYSPTVTFGSRNTQTNSLTLKQHDLAFSTSDLRVNERF